MAWTMRMMIVKITAETAMTSCDLACWVFGSLLVAAIDRNPSLSFPRIDLGWRCSVYRGKLSRGHVITHLQDAQEFQFGISVCI